NERSEFHNSDYLRQALLAKTAQIFYLGRLEPEIFFHFRGLMKEQLPLASAAKFVARKLGVSGFYENCRSWLARKPNRIQASSETANWMTIPFLAIWNWRWFIWRLLQRAKNNRYLRRPIAAVSRGSLMVSNAAKVLKKQAAQSVALNRIASVLHPITSLFQLWRLKRIAMLTISRLQLWRLKVAFEWAWGQRWRIAIPAKRVADKLQIWRLQIMTSRFASEVWRLQVFFVRTTGYVKLQLSKIPFWKVRVLAESIFNQTWRLKVPIQRAFGQMKLLAARLELWKLKAYISNLVAQSWRVRVGAQRLAGNIKAFVWSIPVWKVKPLLWKALYPVRKAYYIGSFQWQKRIAKRLPDSKQERP
ncbi:MAG: hypothetical protein U1E10_06615, partial [Bdellovibrionales bacterium]|nr:hypothetical protein [Bdellovibrionales bacterium]